MKRLLHHNHPQATLFRARAQRQGVRLGAYLFLAVTSMVIGKSVRDALFLSHFTALQMTYADLHIVAAIGLAVSVYVRLQRSLTLRRMLIASSVFFAIGDIACWRAATVHQGWLIRTIYYWVGTQAAITLPQVSMLVREILTTRQAKRVFGLIGTGAIFGWIVGGLVTEAAAGRVGTEALLLVMAALTAAAPILILDIPGVGEPRGTAGRPADRPGPTSHGLLRGATIVWRSPHLRTVAALVFLSSVVTTIAGLQFKAIASQSIGATDRLTAFLGTFSFLAGLVSLAVQILWTSRILQYSGIGAALVMAPLALATASVGVLMWGTLSSAVLLKGSDHVLRHSIDHAAIELLYVPLSPDETMQAKTFIDAIVYRIGDGVGSLAVAFGATALRMSFPSMSVISLGFLAAWIGVAMQARLGYVERLLAMLRQKPDPAPPTPAGENIGMLHAAPGESSEHPNIRLGDPDVARHFDSSDVPRSLAGRLFEPSHATRLELLRALSAFQVCHPYERVEAEPLTTALAAETVGLYLLSEVSRPTESKVSATREYQESIERICRLLKLISPEHEPVRALTALQSADARLKANALEYLENILNPQYRRFLVPLLELDN